MWPGCQRSTVVGRSNCGLHDADDRGLRSPEADDAADDSGVGGEGGLPEAMADDEELGAVDEVVGRGEGAAEEGGGGEGGEEAVPETPTAETRRGSCAGRVRVESSAVVEAQGGEDFLVVGGEGWRDQSCAEDGGEAGDL